MAGNFIISLDFELMWGVRDKKTISTYGKNIIGVREVIPRLLDMFSKYEVDATFATVGMLFCESKEELRKYSPEVKPQYLNQNLSPYVDNFKEVGENELEDNYHFAPELIGLIKRQENHEISTHTFSHFYCLEPGQDLLSFREDLKAAISSAKASGINIKSIVFPRNQSNSAYFKILADFGIDSYRGNEKAWYYNSAAGEKETKFKRFLRLIDSYINVSGHNTYKIDELTGSKPYNIPSSRFLRPYSPSISFLENIRLKRITDSMSYAAKNGQMFHLWWHPHNFGVHQENNFDFLEKILNHYKILNKQYDFQSITMERYASVIKKYCDATD